MVTRLGRKALVGEFLLPSAPTELQCGTCGVVQSSAEEREAGVVHCGCARPASRTRTGSIESCRSDSDTGIISGDEEYEEDAAAFVEPPVQRNVLALATAHLESYPQDVSYRRAQMLRIFDILQPFENAIFTADFNFAEAGEDGFFPANYTDCWKVSGPSRYLLLLFASMCTFSRCTLLPGTRPLLTPQALHQGEAGYTFDSTANPLIREQRKKRARIDRILVKSNYWTVGKCDIIGKQPFNDAYPLLLPSDHFGVTALLQCSSEA